MTGFCLRHQSGLRMKSERTPKLKPQFNTRSLLFVMVLWAVVFASFSVLEKHTGVALTTFYWFVFASFAGGLVGLIIVHVIATRRQGFLSCWLTAAVGGIIGVGLLWLMVWVVYPGAGDFQQPVLLVSSTIGFGVAGGTLAAIISRLLLSESPKMETDFP